MIDVIVNQCSLGLAHGLLDRVKLLGKIKTRPLLVEHLNHPAQVALGTLQPPDDFRMGLVDVAMCHGRAYPPRGDGATAPLSQSGRRLKLELKDHRRLRRQTSQTIPAKIPAETACFRSTTISAVWWDRLVVCAVIYELVSTGNSLLTRKNQRFAPFLHIFGRSKALRRSGFLSDSPIQLTGKIRPRTGNQKTMLRIPRSYRLGRAEARFPLSL
jgi:hypothetical protein